MLNLIEQKLNQLEKKCPFLAIPNLTIGLIIIQVIVYFICQADHKLIFSLLFIPQAVYIGEIWRLLTFIFIPPDLSPLFLFFTWYFFYFLGKNLEEYWGDFRYTLFLLTGWLATCFVGLLFPYNILTISNTFIMSSVFLAFAFFNPDYQILFMLILPLKIKWLAWFTWLSYFFLILTADLGTKLATLASIVNYLIFFGAAHYQNLRYSVRSSVKNNHNKRSEKILETVPTHICKICAATNLSHPDKEFRYCSKCNPHKCFCLEHLKEHIKIHK